MARNINFRKMERQLGIKSHTNRERINYRAYGKQLDASHYHRLLHQKEVYFHPTLPIAVIKTDKNRNIKIIDVIRAVELKPYYEKDSEYKKVLVDGVSKSIHKIVAESYAGEVVPNGYDVHHIDQRKDNYDFNNLIILPRKLHEAIHKE